MDDTERGGGEQRREGGGWRDGKGEKRKDGGGMGNFYFPFSHFLRNESSNYIS